MEIDEIISILREAIEDADWDTIKQLIDELSTDLGNPLDNYIEDDDWFIEKNDEPKNLNK